MKKDPWFPKEYEPTKGVVAKSMVFVGDKWQIYRLADGQNMLVVRPDLAALWESKKLLGKSILTTIKFGGEEFKFLVSSDRYILAPIDYNFFAVNKVTALAFATALRESRKIMSDISFEDSLYTEQFSRLLPTSELQQETDDGLLLGTWLTGGVPVSTKSIRRLQNLTLNFSMGDLEEIIEDAGLTVPTVKGVTKSAPNSTEKVKQKSDKFILTGAEYLEQFFNENVVDIVLNPERYEAMGISFPSPIILYGKPGTGKTYAVEKLAEFLDWPVYSIDSGSVGSPYIHQTAQKISATFNKAFETSPAIVIIDEMESFLGKREGSQDHKVEEVGEFLRLIPEAAKNKVLVVGMTNLLQNIDPAILRTGRFDHKIEVRMPSKEDIKTMLETALAKLPVEDGIVLDKIVDALVDRPRSDIAFIVKEAARLTAFKNKSKISQEEMDASLQTKTISADIEPKRRTIGFTAASETKTKEDK
ncbi:MAG TPA: ATP-binding protein [Alphaproteobacteria bacterium]|nr:ATP-binding protein [Alphaproteobacteria bacterium]